MSPLKLLLVYLRIQVWNTTISWLWVLVVPTLEIAVVDVAVAVIVVYLVREAVADFDPLLSYPLNNILCCSTNSTSFPSMYLSSFLLCICVLLKPCVDCFISFCDTVNTTASFSISVNFCNSSSVLLKWTLGSQSSPQHLKCPKSRVEEIPDVPPCCVNHLSWSVFVTIILWDTQLILSPPKHEWIFLLSSTDQTEVVFIFFYLQHMQYSTYILIYNIHCFINIHINQFISSQC